MPLHLCHPLHFWKNRLRLLCDWIENRQCTGPDEISQECLLIGRNCLAKPLTSIINASITQGIVPDSWKEAVVVPILNILTSCLKSYGKSCVLRWLSSWRTIIFYPKINMVLEKQDPQWQLMPISVYHCFTIRSTSL